MNTPTVIEHLYMILSDERLMILGSKLALNDLATALDELALSTSRQITLRVIQTPHDETTLQAATLTHTTTPLKCTVAGGTAFIAGKRDGLDRLSSSLRYFAEDWFHAGHTHIYPGEGDGFIVSSDSEEVLIGGWSYLPEEYFGPPMED